MRKKSVRMMVSRRGKKSNIVSLSSKLVELCLDGLHIAQHILAATWIAQQCRRVVNGGHQIITLFKPRAMLNRDLEIGFDEAHSGNSTKTNDDLGANEANLLAQIIDASVFFCRQGIAVLGRTAFEDVCDVNVFTINVNRVKKFIKQLSL